MNQSLPYEDSGRDCQLSERRSRSNTVVIDQVRHTATQKRVTPIALYLRHAHLRQVSTDLSEELPKKRRRTEVLVSSNWQPWCPSAGTFSNNDLGFLTSGAIGIRIVPIRAPAARGVLAGEHRVRYRRCLRWGGQRRIELDLAQGVTPKPGLAPVVRPFPEPQGDRSSFLNGLRSGPC